MTRTEKQEARAAANRQRSLEAFMAAKARFDALLAELEQASDDHFHADPDSVLWGSAAWLDDASARLADLADQISRRGEYA